MRPEGPVRIAIIGMGVWSAYGRGVEPILSAVEAGQRALGAARRVPSDPWLHSAPTFEAEGWTPAAGADPWDWACEKAITAAQDAAAAARVACPPGRFAVINGSTHGTNEGINYLRALTGGARDPEWLLGTGARITRRIARVVGAAGPNITINAACSSGLHSIGCAAALIRGGEIDCALAGGNDIVSTLTYLGFNSLRALSVTGCRPLHQRRDGLTLGDGAAYLVLEREKAARRRGAPVLGFVVGYAAGADGHHATAPDPEGLGAQRVMDAALVDADVSTLRLVSAHGTGTPANDAVEIEAIGRVVRALDVRRPVYAFALKSWLGHTLGAAGALEAATTLASMRRGCSPCTWGLDEPVPHDDRLELPRQPLPLSSRRVSALCNAFGFAGSMASLCLESTDE